MQQSPGLKTYILKTIPALKPTKWTTTMTGRGLGARLALAGSGSAVAGAVGMLLAGMLARCAEVSLRCL